MQHDIIAKAGQFIVRTAPLQKNLNIANALQMSWQRQEQFGIEHQLLLLRQSMRSPLLQLPDAQSIWCSGQLHRTVKQRQEIQMSNVPHKHMAAGRNHGDRAFQYGKQVVDVREVLNNRVQNNRIYRTGLDTLEVCRLAAHQFDVPQAVLLTGPAAQIPNGCTRNVCGPIRLTQRCEMLKQETYPAANLQQPCRP